jgi:hypothetical protein
MFCCNFFNLFFLKKKVENAFDRMRRFYPPGGRAENLNQPPATSWQYFHVPKHNQRAFICDGSYQWLQNAGQGNMAWPLGRRRFLFYWSFLVRLLTLF